MPIFGTVSSGNDLSFRNKIINGGFDVWQRATTAGPSAGFVSDRWFFSADTSASWSSSRQSFSLGQTNVPGEPTYFLRITTGASNLTGTLLRTRIEGVRTLAGQSAVLTFWAKVSTGTMVPSYLRLTQNFGTGGSPSTAVVNETTNTITAITTSWQKFTYTYTLASISGKTLGSDNNDYLELGIRIPDNTNISLDISEVQLETGTTPTNFERRPYGTELALCQRYYQSHGNMFQCGYAYGAGTDGFTSNYSFPVTMRVAPTSTVTSGNDGQSSAQLVVSNISTYKCTFEVRAAGGGDNIVWYFWNQAFSAEL